MKDLSLYQISNEVSLLADELVGEGTIVSSPEERHEHLIMLLEKKLDNVVAYDQMLSDHLEIVVKRRKELQELEKRIENRKSRFRDYILQCMKLMKITKLESVFCRITMQKPRERFVVDEKFLPKEYYKEIKVVDSERVKKLIEAGEIIPGAGYVEGEESLRVSTR